MDDRHASHMAQLVVGQENQAATCPSRIQAKGDKKAPWLDRRNQRRDHGGGGAAAASVLTADRTDQSQPSIFRGIQVAAQTWRHAAWIAGHGARSRTKPL